MLPITNRAAADFIEEYSVLLELSGVNPFRVRAYTNAGLAMSEATKRGTPRSPIRR